MSKYYVTNDELIKEIDKFKENGEASEEFGKMLLDIANGLSSKGNFKNYTYKDEMVGEAVQTCIRYGRNYNTEVSKNAFAYLTKICYQSFVGYIKKQGKHSKIKDECYQQDDVLEEAMGKGAVDYTKFSRPKGKEIEAVEDGSVTMRCPFCHKKVFLKKANQKTAKCGECNTVFKPNRS